MSLSQKFGLTGRFIFWFLFVALIPALVIGYLSYTNSSKALETETKRF